jgi:four helix bundle protein
MTSEIKSYKELDVWLETRSLSKEIYLVARTFPKEEQYGLINQMRRCAISIPSNIAEGCGRNHSKDSIQFCISRGSLYELETQLYLSFDLSYIDNNALNQLLSCIETSRKLLNGFIKYYQKLDR